MQSVEKENEMVNRNITNFHVEYMDVTQHWNEKSEQFAGADGLLTMLYNGWEMKKKVKRQEHWFAGMRAVCVYHIELERNGETVTMPVIQNPYIGRMLLQNGVEVTDAQ
ncbi:MAG: hypothetical protein OHK0046_36130 [Anaerolineae bacterium]